MQIIFTRLSMDGLHALRIERGDGIVFEAPSSRDRKGYIPHDMQHLLTDQAFEVHDGFWGTVAAGALFKSLPIVEGRLRHDAYARSKAVIKQHAAGLQLTEVIGGPAYHAVEHGHDLETAFKALQRTWGSIRTDPLPYDRTVLARAIDAFAAARTQWAQLPVGEAMTFHWTLRERPR